MKVIILRGKYHTGKTIVLIMLLEKFYNFKYTDKNYVYNYSKSNIKDYSNIFGSNIFDSRIKRKISATPEKKIDRDDFFAIFEIDGKKVLLISYSTTTDDFKKIFQEILNIKPHLILFCTKEIEQPKTIYVGLQDFLKKIKPQNYLEVPIYKVRSTEIYNAKKLVADKLFNVIIRTVNGETLSELDK